MEEISPETALNSKGGHSFALYKAFQRSVEFPWGEIDLNANERFLSL